MADAEITDFNLFDKGLERFDMKNGPGLIYVANKEGATAYERIALEIAEKYGATAVYFRKFINDKRPSIPQVYIYDYTTIDKRDEDIAELHKRLWNSAQVPLFIVFRKHNIQIFNSLNPPDIDEVTGELKLKVLDLISISAEYEKLSEKERKKYDDFSARKFDNGSFWDSTRHKNKFDPNQTINEKLLFQLKYVKREMIKRKILDEELTKKLLVKIILIKYLEERKDEKGNQVFPDGYFKKFTIKAEKFSDVLRERGGCLKLFDALGEHFNGRILDVSDKKERSALENTDLTDFADFIDGNIQGRQYNLWPLYSFKDLPVEIISNIYEDFLSKKKKKTGIVYTPPYLVNFLVDECMPLSESITNYKILDPACGSGIFLVATYQRLVFRWRKKNDWQEPNLEDLRKLLKDNIFGVDQSEEAVRLTAFSLCLALCDMLSPKEWQNLTFDDLFKKNLIAEDFFKLIADDRLEKDFDLVIGNPPFIKINTESAKKIEKQRIKVRPKIPYKKLALLFLEQAIELCKDNGMLCLILPAGPFLYNKTSGKFRKHFLSKYNTIQILDFVSLQEGLFKSSTHPVIAVFAKKEKPKGNSLFHITIRKTESTKDKLFFELDYYDFHRIPFKEALDNKYVWKSNLMGGGRIRYLVDKLTSMRSLSDYLDVKCEDEKWVVGEGYQRGNKRKAEFITGKKMLPAEAFTEDGIDETKIVIETSEYFYWPRNKYIYEAPHVLIKETGKNSIPIVYVDYYLTFTHRIVGIHAPKEQVEELKFIEAIFKKSNRTFLFSISCTSSSLLIKKSTAIEKNDIDRIPYPENEKEMGLSPIEKILVDDVVDNMLDFHRKGEKSKVFKKVNDQQLEEFAEVYCKILNSVYKDLKAMEPVKTDSFICYPFYFKEKPDVEFSKNNIEKLEKYLNILIDKKYKRANLRMIRVMQIYDKNAIYLIKPNQLRYWLKSIAIRDADDTFADLVEQGY